MTKTFNTVLPYRFVNPGLSAMMPVGTTAVYRSFVWNFEFWGHWDLFEIWILVLGIFMFLIK